MAANLITKLSAARRGEILRAALSLVAEQGFEGLRTRDLAARVGINVSTLHYYFSSKEALVADLVDYVAQLFRTLRAPLPEHPTSLDELHSIFASRAHRRAALPELDIVVQEAMTRARRDEALRQVLTDRQSTWTDLVEDTLVRCIRDGYVRADLNPKAAAGAIASFIIGADTQLGVWPARFSYDDAVKQLMAGMTEGAR